MIYERFEDQDRQAINFKFCETKEKLKEYFNMYEGEFNEVQWKQHIYVGWIWPT